MTVGSNMEPVERAPEWIMALGREAHRHNQGKRLNGWDEVPLIVVNADVYREHFTTPDPDPDFPESAATVFGIRVIPDPTLGPDEARLRWEIRLPDLFCTCGAVEAGLAQHLSPCPFYRKPEEG